MNSAFRAGSTPVYRKGKHLILQIYVHWASSDSLFYLSGEARLCLHDLVAMATAITGDITPAHRMNERLCINIINK